MASRRGSLLFGQFLNAPNMITYLRIIAIPAVLFTMQFDSRRNAFIAAMIFAVASATDALDGYLARRFNLISVIGKFLDPLADKLIVMGALVMLLHLGRVSAWLVVVILAREIIINGLRTVAIGEGLVISARELGKQKTATQMIGIWCLIIHYPHQLWDLFGEPVRFNVLGTWFLYISVVFSVVSALDYFVGFFHAVNEAESPPEPEPPSPRKEGDAASPLTRGEPC